MDWPQFRKAEKHNYAVDILRFLASLVVVLFHLNRAIAPEDNWYRNLVKYGWLGVPMFFVISGYCIALSANNSGSAAAFITKRLFRIFPPYWFSILFVLFAALFQKLYLGSNAVHYIPHNLKEIAATLSLTTTPLSNINTVNWVYWTLTCELFFYLAVTLVLLFKKQYTGYLLIVWSILAAIWAPQSGTLFFLAQWPAFGLGIGVFYFFNTADRRSLVYFGALLLVNCCGLIMKFGFSPYSIWTFVTLVLLFTSHYLKLRPNLFATLGQHAYSVYLIHVPLGVFIFGLFQPLFFKQYPWPNLLYDLGVYAVISLAAWLMFLYIEQPSIVIGKKAAAGFLTKQPA